MATGRLDSLGRVRAFVEGGGGLNFVALDGAWRNDFVRRVLVKFGYAALGGRTSGW